MKYEVRPIVIYSERIAEQIVNTTKAIIAEQQMIILAFCDNSKFVFEKEECNLTYPILQETPQHRQKGWYRKFEKKKGF